MAQFDQVEKSLADLDPAATVHLFGGIPWEVEITAVPLEREVIVPLRTADQVFRVEFSDGREPEISHFEAGLALKYQLPVRTNLLFLSPRRAAAAVEARQGLQFGQLRIESEFNIVRVWEMDPRPILERQEAAERERLLAELKGFVGSPLY